MWILIAILLLVAGDAWGQLEARCIELGANCACSEPLNTPTLVDMDGVHLNPSDSSDPDFECGVPGKSGAAFQSSNLSTINAVTAEFPWPDTIDWVSRITTPPGTTGLLGSVADGYIPPGAKRYCHRWYAYYSGNSARAGEPVYESKDLTGPSPQCEANKIVEWGWGGGSGGAVFHPNEASKDWTFHICKGGTNVWSAVTDDPRDTTTCPGPSDACRQTAGNNFQISDCYGEICRIETCAWSPTDLHGGLDIYTSMEAEVITGPQKGLIGNFSSNNGTTGYMYCGDANGDGVGGSIDHVLANLYRQGTCDGFKEVSHSMSAWWNTPGDETGPFIGAASEIEDDPEPPPLLASNGFEASGCTSTTFGLASGAVVNGTVNCDHDAFGVTEGSDNYFANADTNAVQYAGIVSTARVGQTTVSFDFWFETLPSSTANYAIRFMDGTSTVRPEFATRESNGNPAVQMRCDSLQGGWAELELQRRYRAHLTADYTNDDCMLKVYDEGENLVVDHTAAGALTGTAQTDGIFIRMTTDNNMAVDNMKLWNGLQAATDNAPPLGPAVIVQGTAALPAGGSIHVPLGGADTYTMRLQCFNGEVASPTSDAVVTMSTPP
jgi:hypothetical protein